MKLFLASSLNQTMGLLIPRLPKSPTETKVVFIANAADPFKEKPWVNADRNAFIAVGFPLSEIDLTQISGEELKRKLETAEIVHFCGGSVMHLLSVLQGRGTKEAIANAVKTDKVIYTGSSAGSIVAATSVEIYTFDAEEKEFSNGMADFSAFGFTNAVIVPHVNDPQSKESNAGIVEHAVELSVPLLFLRDNQALWIDGSKSEILSL